MSRRTRWLWLVIGTAAIGGIAYGAYAYLAREGAEARQFRLATAERGPIQSVVSAAGTLNAVTTVQVGSQISGQVKEVLVDFNAAVKKNQVIARIDPQSFELRIAQARADLEASRAAIEVARSTVNQLRVELARVNVTVGETTRDLQRKRLLVEKAFIAASEADKAQAAHDTAREQARGVQAQIATAEAQVGTALANLKQRESILRQAEVDLERTVIRAPVNGIVISRTVDAGQTVAASLQAPTLFTIAQDLREMQVDTAVDEADVGRLRVDQEASFTVDAFPNRTFQGKILQIRKAPLIQQNVVTYVVVVSAANPDLALLPGMTANVRIIVDARDNALKIPNAALRFRPGGADAPTSGNRQAADPLPRGGGFAAGGPGASGPGGQAQQFRNRVLTELKLDDQQRARVEAIFGEARQKMMGLREITDDAERRRTAERTRSETRARIAAVLAPEQQALFERIAAEFGGVRSTVGRVWVLDAEGKPKAIDLRLGLTDGSATEVVSGALDEGTQVIIGTATGSGGAQPRTGGPPRFF